MLYKKVDLLKHHRKIFEMHSSDSVVVLTLVSIFFGKVSSMESSLLIDYTTRLIKTEQSIMFACSEQGM